MNMGQLFLNYCKIWHTTPTLPCGAVLPSPEPCGGGYLWLLVSEWNWGILSLESLTVNVDGSGLTKQCIRRIQSLEENRNGNSLGQYTSLFSLADSYKSQKMQKCNYSILGNPPRTNVHVSLLLLYWYQQLLGMQTSSAQVVCFLYICISPTRHNHTHKLSIKICGMKEWRDGLFSPANVFSLFTLVFKD